MKSIKDFRTKTNSSDSEDFLKKAAKLEPIKKSGKEKRTIFSALNGSEDDDEDLAMLRKRDSILDYFDDGDEDTRDEDEDEDEFDDEDEESEEFEEDEELDEDEEDDEDEEEIETRKA